MRRPVFALLTLVLVGTPIWAAALGDNVANLKVLPFAARALGRPIPDCSNNTHGAQARLARVRLALGEARAAMLGGACDDALAILDDIGGEESNRLRAVIWIAQGKNAEARDALRSVSTPADARAAWLGDIGMAEADAGQFVSAARMFELARTIGTLPARASVAYAHSLEELGRFDSAVAVSREAVVNAPAVAETHDALAAALWLVRPGVTEAIAESERAVELRDYFPYRFRLGQFYSYVGRVYDAEAQFRLVAASEVGALDGLSALGSVLAVQGRLPEAAQAYHRALDIGRRDADRERLASICELIEVDVSAAPAEACTYAR